MPCHVPASAFAKVPGISIVPVGSRYFLTLLPHNRLPSNALTCMPADWGLVDYGLEGLAAATGAHRIPPVGCSFWQRRDGVTICAGDAATRNQLMALVNRTVTLGNALCCSEHRHRRSAEGFQAHCPPSSQTAAQTASAQPPTSSPQAPQPLTVYSDPRKRSLAVALRPASLKCSVTPPPEGPRKRQHRLAAADAALQNMGNAIAQLQQAALTLQGNLQDLRNFA